MKILVVPSWYGSKAAPSRGSFIRDQAVAVSDRGIEVVVVALDRDSGEPVLDTRKSFENGVSHIRIAVPAPWHRVLGFYAPGILARRLRDIVEAEKPDVVHAHAVRPAGVVSELALRKLDVPWCLTEHSSPLRAFWWTAHGRRQINRAYSAADRLFGVSNSLVEDMKSLFPEGARTAELLYNGIDSRIFRLPDAQHRASGARLLFVGGLVAQKAVHNLIEAVSGLPRDLDWTLSLVGVGPLQSTLRAQADALGIAGRLDWRGAVPRASMPALYREHDLLVVSSIAETFSLVSAEALACGIPVVATRCGGPEEVIGPLGLPLVPPGDPLALREAIHYMLNQLSDFDRKGAAESIEQRFSMAALAARLETIYAEIIRERK